MNPNWMVVCIQPDEGIALEFAAKRPGPAVALSSVSMDFAYRSYFEMAPRTGYETLIYDCMIGDAILFQRRSEEHTSELQSLMRISYAVFCLTKKKTTTHQTRH